MQLETTINSRRVTLAFPPGESLYTTLRRYGYLGVKQGCETSSCGLCTVWLNGRPVLSCTMLSARVGGQEITTIEGVQEEAAVFADFMTAEGAEQCGFCSPGFTMTVLAMKRELNNPSDDEINHYLAGNLCRCSGYKGQLRAVRNYLEAGS